MEEKLVKLFCGVKCEADCNAAEKVWNVIAARDERIARMKLWSFSTLGFISLIALFPAFITLSSDFSQSGFFEYLSLGFSSDTSMFSYWKELAFSLMESLPTVSIILSLSLFFIFFLSIKYAAKQVVKSRLSFSS